MPDSLAVRIRRCIALFYAAGALLLFLRVAWVAVTVGPSIGRIVVALVLIALALGLAKGRPAALKTTGAICLLIAVFLPAAIFSPFAVGDYLAAGQAPPSFPGSLVWLVPLEALLLASAYALDLRGSK